MIIFDIAVAIIKLFDDFFFDPEDSKAQRIAFYGMLVYMLIILLVYLMTNSIFSI